MPVAVVVMIATTPGFTCSYKVVSTWSDVNSAPTGSTDGISVFEINPGRLTISGSCVWGNQV